jgi:hypothetical protein
MKRVSRQITLGLVAVAGVLAVVMVVQLWRSRRTGGPWDRRDSLAVLGLLVAFLGIVVPLLASDGAGGEEDPEVRSYRQEVGSACRSLAPTTNPLMDAMNDDGSVDRDKLLEGFRNQARAAEGVLDALWSKKIPEELADDARSAEASSRAYLTAARNAFDRIETEQPATMSFQQVSAVFGGMDAELRPAASEMESAMSRLAGRPCAAPGASPAV